MITFEQMTHTASPRSDMIRTPDQRVRVFVSSALGELAAERQAVRDAVTRLRLVPVDPLRKWTFQTAGRGVGSLAARSSSVAGSWGRMA